MSHENVTKQGREVWVNALASADRRGTAKAEPAHPLLALLNETDGTAPGLLQAAGSDPAKIEEAAAKAVADLPCVSPETEVKSQPAPALLEVWSTALHIAQ